jgi:hypothetical protein
MRNWPPKVALLNELIQHQFPARYDTGWASEDGGGPQTYYVFSRGRDTVIAEISGSLIHPWVVTYGEEDPQFTTIARRYAEVRRADSAK